MKTFKWKLKNRILWSITIAASLCFLYNVFSLEAENMTPYIIRTVMSMTWLVMFCYANEKRLTV